MLIGRAVARLLIAFVLALGALPGLVCADPVEEFYKGKTLRMVIGYGVGGGYDIYGRVAAEFLGRYIPGNPTMVPQNMPGAGSFAAAKYLNSAAPRDGTAFGMVAQTLPLDAATGGDKVDVDVTQMPYIGRLTSNIDLGVGIPGAKFKTFEDARQREIVVGATGGASPALLLPMALNKYAGAKFKIVSGYSGANDVLLAAERGEVELIGAIGIPNLLVRNPDWIRQGKASIIYQCALSRHPLLPNVPALPELGLTDEGRAVLRLIANSAEIGRSVIATPGVPPERIAALRKAFQAMVADPAFQQEMAKRNISIEPATGEELDKIARETMQAPKRVLELTGELLKLK